MSVAKSALAADASSSLEFDSDTRPIRMHGVEQPLSLVANEPLHKVLVACSSEERFRRIEGVLAPEFHCEYVPTLEVCARITMASSLDLVVADAELCNDELLKQIAERGLANSCLILADARELEELVDRYASQHVFRVLSREVRADTLRTFVRNAFYPREASRRSLPGIVAKLATSDSGFSDCALLDLSNSGLAVQTDPREGSLLPGATIATVQLWRGHELVLDGVQAAVRYVEVLAMGRDDLAYKTGLELKRVATPVNEELENVTEPVRVLSILQDGLRRSSTTVRIANGGKLVSTGSATELVRNPSGIRVREQPPDELELGDVVEVRFDHAGASHSFLSSVKAIGGDSAHEYVITLPRIICIARQRRSARYRPQADRPVEIVFTSPFTGLAGGRAAINLTASGAAFPIDDKSELLPVGTRIPQLTLRFHDGTQLTCRASVRSVRRLGDGGKFSTECGVEFDGLSPAERARIADAIVHSGWPTLRDGTGTGVDVLWNFLLDTKFIYPEKLKSMKVEQVQETLTKLLERPNDVFKTTLVVSQGRIEGHASSVRAYRQTWILQHLAARLGKSAMTRGRMLNLAVIEYLEQIPGIEWVRIWYRPANRWPARVFGGFARRLTDRNLSDHRVYGYMVSPTSHSGPTPTDVSLRPSDAQDCHWIEAYFVGRRESVALRAEDLTNRHLFLPEVQKAYAEVGLSRRREIIVAERRGKPVGFAMLEISSLGLNFSELTNTFRVYTLDDNRATHVALAGASRERFRELGFERCVALAQDDAEAFAMSGFEQVKEYACWTWHRSQYQAFCEHVLRLRA